MDFSTYLLRCHNNFRVLRKVPKGARILVADALGKLLHDVVLKNQPPLAGYCILVFFCYFGLRVPEKESPDSPDVSLTTKIKRQVTDFFWQWMFCHHFQSSFLVTPQVSVVKPTTLNESIEG